MVSTGNVMFMSKNSDEYGTEPAMKPKRHEFPEESPRNHDSRKMEWSKRSTSIKEKEKDKKRALIDERDDWDTVGERSVSNFPRHTGQKKSVKSPRPLALYRPPQLQFNIEGSSSDDAATAGSSVYYQNQTNYEKQHPIRQAVSELTTDTKGGDTNARSTMAAGIYSAATSIVSIPRLAFTKDETWTLAQNTTGFFSDDLDEEYGHTFTSNGTEHSEVASRNVQKQSFGVFTVAITTIQLAVLLIQLLLCGMAPLEVNPMIGPFPDAFSEWGGKNTYLMLEGRQYFRLFTPAVLHVGLLHFLVNAFCQLQSCSVYECEWGSCRWFTAYVTSTIGAVATACVVDPNEIGTSSSGALMGVFGAKTSQIIAYSCFEVYTHDYKDYVRANQIAVMLCNISVVILLSLVTYIDLSAHVGGFSAGFLIGMLLFCRGIKSTCVRFLWAFTGVAGILAGIVTLWYLLWVETYPDEELSDACQYFRNLYPEGYECECQWGS